MVNKLDLNYFGEKNREKKPMKKELGWNYRDNKTKYFFNPFLSRARRHDAYRVAIVFTGSLLSFQYDVQSVI